MDTTNIRKPFLRLLPVQIGTCVIGSVNALVDTVFTARFLGKEAAAGIGFFSPMLTIIYLGVMILNGTQILCGRAVGKGKRGEVISLFTTAFVTLLGYGLLLGLGGFFLRIPLSASLGARDQAALYLQRYMAGFMPGVPFLLLASQMMMFLPCNNDIRLSYGVMACMVVSNALMDYLSVCVLQLETMGLGMASSLSYLLSFLICLPRYCRKEKAYRVNLRSINFRLMKDAARLGLPDLAFNLGVTLRSWIMNISVMGLIGTAGVAALNVQNSLLSFLGAVAQGNAIAFTVLGSIYYGEKDRTSLKHLAGFAMKTGGILSSILMFALITGASWIAACFFPAGSETYLLTRQMLRLFSSVFVWNSFLVILNRGFQIQGYLKQVNLLNFLEQMFTAIIAAAGIRMVGIIGVWLSSPLADILCLLLIGLWITRVQGRFPRKTEEWLQLPSDFGAKENDILEFTVADQQEVTSTSIRVMDFCKERGIDPRRTIVTGLAVEEMAGNVIAYGKQVGKRCYIEVRLVIGEPLVIRIRDDCLAFDPTLRIQQFTPEDPAKNVGIRMIGKMAAEMNYHNDAGINTLLIRV